MNAASAGTELGCEGGEFRIRPDLFCFDRGHRLLGERIQGLSPVDMLKDLLAPFLHLHWISSIGKRDQNLADFLVIHFFQEDYPKKVPSSKSHCILHRDLIL